jgi:hypothetical protein
MISSKTRGWTSVFPPPHTRGVAAEAASYYFKCSSLVTRKRPRLRWNCSRCIFISIMRLFLLRTLNSAISYLLEDLSNLVRSQWIWEIEKACWKISNSPTHCQEFARPHGIFPSDIILHRCQACLAAMPMEHWVKISNCSGRIGAW